MPDLFLLVTRIHTRRRQRGHEVVLFSFLFCCYFCALRSSLPFNFDLCKDDCEGVRTREESGIACVKRTFFFF